MIHKRTLGLVVTFFMLFSTAACMKNDDTGIDTENSTVLSVYDYSETDTVNKYQPVSTSVAENTETTTVHSITPETTTLSVPTTIFNDPSAWSVAKIVDEYKKAAEKSDSKVTSQQIIEMADISVNNGDGAFNGVFQFIKPIISKVLENNSTDFSGITGGYENLSQSDIYEATAYASGDNTVIEMILREQVDGAKGDPLSGTVGHAISVVGDISVVTKQINDLGLPIEISDENTSITYRSASVTVLIDSNGMISNGTWSYVAEINMNYYQIGKSVVENTSVVLENVITVDGGFNE